MNIVLRPWHIDDLETLVSIANNQNIAKYMADVFPHPYSIENGNSFINLAINDAMKSPPTAVRFAITVNEKAIGGIGLHLQSDILRKNAEIGYWLSEAYWGKGVMANAVHQIVKYGFENLDIVRIFARIYGTNIPSQKLVEKCGFKLEGKYHKTIFKNNEFLDELIYAVRK